MDESMKRVKYEMWAARFGRVLQHTVDAYQREREIYQAFISMMTGEHLA
jgi:hypothetical protein